MVLYLSYQALPLIGGWGLEEGGRGGSVSELPSAAAHARTLEGGG